MNEVLPQKLVVISEEQYHAFYRLESIAHLTTIVLHLNDLTWCEAIARRFDRAKTEALRLEWIELRFMGWYSGFVSIIEAIGRLRCRLNLFLGLLPAVDMDYGNIGGLYVYVGREEPIAVERWLLENLGKTRIRRVGRWFGYCVADFVDNYALACKILEEPDSLMHSIVTYYPDSALILRRHNHCMDALQNARVRFAVCCKRKGIPRDIMRIIVSHLYTKDWEDTVKTPQEPKWVKDTLNIYNKMLVDNAEVVKYFGLADRTGNVETFQYYKRLQQFFEAKIEELKQELREIQKRWTTNKFGVRVMGPRKKLKV